MISGGQKLKIDKLNKLKNYLMIEPITIPAKKMRFRIGEILDNAHFRHQPYLITRRKKPTVIMLGIEDYEDLIELITEKKGERKKEDTNVFFEMVDKIRERTKGMDYREIEEVVNEAVEAVRKK